MRVLVVDDEEMIRTLASKVLSRAEIDVTTAESGADGLARSIQDPTIEVAVIDMTLPDTDGLELIRRMFHNRSDLKFILSSGQALTENDIPVELAGVVSLLPKPYRSQALISLINRLTQQGSQVPQSSR